MHLLVFSYSIPFFFFQQVGGEYNGRGAKFNGGAYVFEDDFDAWSGVFNERDIAGMPYSTTYGSALW